MRDIIWKYVNTAEKRIVVRWQNINGNSVHGAEALKIGQVISRKSKCKNRKRGKYHNSKDWHHG